MWDLESFRTMKTDQQESIGGVRGSQYIFTCTQYTNSFNSSLMVESEWQIMESWYHLLYTLLATSKDALLMACFCIMIWYLNRWVAWPSAGTFKWGKWFLRDWLTPDCHLTHFFLLSEIYNRFCSIVFCILLKNDSEIEKSELKIRNRHFSHRISINKAESVFWSWGGYFWNFSGVPWLVTFYIFMNMK